MTNTYDLYRKVADWFISGLEWISEAGYNPDTNFGRKKGLFWRFWSFWAICHRGSPGTPPWPPRPVWWSRAMLGTFVGVRLAIRRRGRGSRRPCEPSKQQGITIHKKSQKPENPKIKKLQNSQNFKNLQNFCSFQVPAGLSVDPNFHFGSIFRYDAIVPKNIFCYYTVPKACPMLHTKNQIKKDRKLAAMAQKVQKSCPRTNK